MNENDRIIRTLSTGTIISSLVFSKLNAAKQTEILAVAQTAGKPFVFVDSFGKLADTRRLAERLLAGEDVAMELEFNNIELSDDERDGLDKVRPLLERLKALKPAGYQWLPDAEINAAKSHFDYTQSDRVYHRAGGEYISKATARAIWNVYAPFVMGVAEKPKVFKKRIGYSNRNITINDDFSVKVGCQTVSRADVEYVARHFKFADRRLFDVKHFELGTVGAA